MGETRFGGAKLALFIGQELLIYLRDDRPDIPWPGCWDFPGGGREGDETPEACVLRETEEEFGLRLAPGDLGWRVVHPGASGQGAVFFAAHLPAGAQAAIRFGDEGQGWRLVPPGAYLAETRAIPHLQRLLADYLSRG